MILQPEHFRFLSALNEHGCLDSQYVHAHFFANVGLRRCQQITASLAKEGFTELVKMFATRLSEKEGNTPNLKRIPALNFLTEVGAIALFDATGEEPNRVMRSAPQPHTLLHRLGVVKNRLAFDRSLAGEGLANARWILESDSQADIQDKKLPPNQRSKLYHQFSNNGSTFSCRPDAVCTCEIESTKYYLIWEHDRSTEGSKQLARKARGLNALIQRRAFERYWTNVSPSDKLRIFWTVPSPQRAKSICASISSFVEVLNRSRFLVSADLSSLSEDGIDTRNWLRDPIWMMPTGGWASLLK